MPLFDAAAFNASLDNDYGTTHGTHAPDSFTVHLYDEDPRDAGVEITGTGYAAVTVANSDANFPAATEGRKRAVVDFGTAGSDWPTALWWLLKDASGGDPWECAAFNLPVDAASGNGVTVVITIQYDPEAT